MQRFISVFGLCVLLISLVFASTAHASGGGPSTMNPVEELFAFSVTLGGTVTAVANTVSVIRWKKPHWGWRVGGIALGALAVANASLLGRKGGTDEFGHFLYNLLFLMPANLLMGTWANFLPEQKVKLSVGPIPMIDARGAIVPAVGLQLVRF